MGSARSREHISMEVFALNNEMSEFEIMLKA